MRELERFQQKVFTDDLEPGRLTHGAVLVQRFVDNVPAADLTLVAANYRPDVLLHPVEQSFASERVALFVLKDPARRLAMPNQTVADDEHLVLFSEGDVAIGGAEFVAVHPWVNGS